MLASERTSRGGAKGATGVRWLCRAASHAGGAPGVPGRERGGPAFASVVRRSADQISLRSRIARPRGAWPIADDSRPLGQLSPRTLVFMAAQAIQQVKTDMIARISPASHSARSHAAKPALPRTTRASVRVIRGPAVSTAWATAFPPCAAPDLAIPSAPRAARRVRRGRSASPGAVRSAADVLFSHGCNAVVV
jgi:hypothetical protein